MKEDVGAGAQGLGKQKNEHDTGMGTDIEEGGGFDNSGIDIKYRRNK